MVLGPIPWESICRYADRFGFGLDGLITLERMIRTMDDAFLAYMHKKAESPKAPPEPNQDGGP